MGYWFRILPVAHGALGIFDELFGLLAVVIFIVVLTAPALSAYLRQRGQASQETQVSPDRPPSSPEPAPTPEKPSSRRADHYRLD